MSGLPRALHPMPVQVRDALQTRRLLPAYASRPPYQRNDYLGRIVGRMIARAKREDTRAKRLQQMLDELQRGDVSMGMAWRPRGGH